MDESPPAKVTTLQWVVANCTGPGDSIEQTKPAAFLLAERDRSMSSKAPMLFNYRSKVCLASTESSSLRSLARRLVSKDDSRYLRTLRPSCKEFSRLRSRFRKKMDVGGSVPGVGSHGSRSQECLRCGLAGHYFLN